MYGSLRGCLRAKPVVLFKIRNCSQDTMWQLAGVQMLSAVNSGRPSDIHSLVTVQMRDHVGEFILVDIGTILGLAHLVPEGDWCWLVSSRINLGTFNEIY